MADTLVLYTPTSPDDAPIDHALCRWGVAPRGDRGWMAQCRRRGVLQRWDGEIRLCRQHAVRAWTDCEGCGGRLTRDERQYPVEDEDGDLRWWCNQCECDTLHFTCIQCKNCGEKASQHRLLVVVDAEEVEMPQGVYLIRDLPYYTAGMIGASWLHDQALAYLGPLPEGMSTDPEDYDYPCGHLCGECIAAYQPDARWAVALVWWG